MKNYLFEKGQIKKYDSEIFITDSGVTQYMVINEENMMILRYGKKKSP